VCGGRVGDVVGGGDRRGGAGRVDAEQVGAALPHERVLAGGGGPGQFGDQLVVEREPGAFGGDPLDAVGDGAAGDEVRSARPAGRFGVVRRVTRPSPAPIWLCL